MPYSVGEKKHDPEKGEGMNRLKEAESIGKYQPSFYSILIQTHLAECSELRGQVRPRSTIDTRDRSSRQNNLVAPFTRKSPRTPLGQGQSSRSPCGR